MSELLTKEQVRGLRGPSLSPGQFKQMRATALAYMEAVAQAHRIATRALAEPAPKHDNGDTVSLVEICTALEMVAIGESSQMTYNDEPMAEMLADTLCELAELRHKYLTDMAERLETLVSDKMGLFYRLKNAEAKLAEKTTQSCRACREEVAELQRRLAEAEAPTAFIEKWLIDNPRAFQISLRRMESTGEFICRVEHAFLGGFDNYSGKTVNEAIDAAREGGKHGEK